MGKNPFEDLNYEAIIDQICKKADSQTSNFTRYEIDLAEACENGLLSRAVEILDKYPEALSFKDSAGLFLLIIAAGNDQSEIIRYLVHRGADKDQTVNLNGWTALMNAACFGHVKSTVALLSLGANPQICSLDGLTAMDIAEANGQKQVCLVFQKYFALLANRR